MTSQVGYFCNTKDRVPLLNQSYVVYKFVCPGCKASYIGKTERTLHERTVEHGWTDENSAVRRHIDACDGVEHIQHQLTMGVDDPDVRQLHVNLVRQNVYVIDRANNWNVLLFKEAFRIKQLNPTLNYGLKASKDLELF